MRMAGAAAIRIRGQIRGYPHARMRARASAFASADPKVSLRSRVANRDSDPINQLIDCTCAHARSRAHDS
jgi:hypothetical protein